MTPDRQIHENWATEDIKMSFTKLSSTDAIWPSDPIFILTSFPRYPVSHGMYVYRKVLLNAIITLALIQYRTEQDL